MTINEYREMDSTNGFGSHFLGAGVVGGWVRGFLLHRINPKPYKPTPYWGRQCPQARAGNGGNMTFAAGVEYLRWTHWDVPPYEASTKHR